MSMNEKLQLLNRKRAAIAKGGGDKAIEKQHQKGKLTARERIDLLADPGSFCEIDAFVQHRCTHFGMDEKELAADGVVCGHGTVDGRPVYIFAQDFTVSGGSLGEAHAAKISKLQDLAVAHRVPIICINDSGGARIQEGIGSLRGYGDIFFRNTRASGYIPQISVIIGPCAGGAVYSPAITDFVFLVEKLSQMFITGPEVIKTVLGEEISMEDLGGARVHNEKSGNAHFLATDEKDCFEKVRRLLSFIPASCKEEAERRPAAEPRCGAKIAEVVPDNPKLPYDVKDVIAAIVDDSDFFESMRYYAPNIVTGFARLDGRTIGIIANQPACLAGVLDVNASDKAARFIRFCDCFNIPLLTLEDLPGYLPGIDQEHSGVIRHGAKLLYAYSEATVPKVTVILRKGYGGGYIGMCSRHIGADFVFAWPIAEVAVMGAQGAAKIIFRKEIGSAEDPTRKEQEMVELYKDRFANPYEAAKQGYVDDIIDPAGTRGRLIAAFAVAGKKSADNLDKKHGNIPL